MYVCMYVCRDLCVEHTYTSPHPTPVNGKKFAFFPFSRLKYFAVVWGLDWVEVCVTGWWLLVMRLVFYLAFTAGGCNAEWLRRHGSELLLQTIKFNFFQLFFFSLLAGGSVGGVRFCLLGNIRGLLGFL